MLGTRWHGGVSPPTRQDSMQWRVTRRRDARRASRRDASAPGIQSTVKSRRMKPIERVPEIRRSTFDVYFPFGNANGSFIVR